MIYKHSILLILLVCFLSACTKISETQIGTGLIPAVDGVVTKDTSITIEAKTWNNTDTISPSLYDDHTLGYINDPLFGTTNAVINLQLLPSSFPFTFEVSKDSLTLDSVVLALATRGVWGDTMQNISLHVKEIADELSFVSDSLVNYNNTTQFAATNDLTYNGSASINPATWDDSFHVYKDSGTNMIRIRLTDDFGNKLLKTFTYPGQYDSTLAFKAAFKGFQISADPMIGNCLLRIGLANSTSFTGEPNTKLALYYHYINRDSISHTTIDTTVKYFTVNTTSNTPSSSLAHDLGSAHSNYIKRDYSMGQIAGFYNPADTVNKNSNYVYIASAPGTYATIRIDTAALRGLPNLIIHRAEILMEQVPDPLTPGLDNYTAPNLFMLVKPDQTLSFQKDTTKFLIPGFNPDNINSFDALFSSGSFANYTDFGGIPHRKNNSDGTNINYYNFNVSRYVQGILTNKNSQYTFAVYTPYKEIFRYINGIASYGRVASAPINPAGVGRVKLYGGGTDVTNPHRMKLHIIYSIPH